MRPLLVDVKQAARLLAIGRTKLYELIDAGAIRPVRIGRCVRFAVEELNRFVADGCVASQPHGEVALPAVEATVRRRNRARRVDVPNLFEAVS
jgi:excisionase family DNA binding protein